jgi:cytochrome P450
VLPARSGFFVQDGAPQETELGGYRIPKGVWLHVFPWALHRSPRLFPEPLCFDPERFIPERVEEIVPYSYIPFGVGPHICIGKEFASMQMVLTVATVLQQCRLAPSTDHRPLPEPDVVVRPKGGLRLVVTRHRRSGSG